MVGVSGGGDSLALLHLMREHGFDCEAVTVNHRLRPGSAAAAAFVQKVCRNLDVPHRVASRPPGADWSSQERAREGRYRMLSSIAREREAPVVVGHTLDDQAETVRMRASRGGGTLGLSGMAPVATLKGQTLLLRPLLHASRSDLQSYLLNRSLLWIDDPANEDRRFERVRTRDLADQEGERCIGRFADVCRRERAQLARTVAGDFALNLRRCEDGWLYAPRLRGVALVHALRWLAADAGRSTHLPSQARVAAFVAREQGLTIAGAVLRKRGAHYVVAQEPRRTRTIDLAPERFEDVPFSRFRPQSDDPVFTILRKLEAPAT